MTLLGYVEVFPCCGELPDPTGMLSTSGSLIPSEEIAEAISSSYRHTIRGHICNLVPGQWQHSKYHNKFTVAFLHVLLLCHAVNHLQALCSPHNVWHFTSLLYVGMYC